MLILNVLFLVISIVWLRKACYTRASLTENSDVELNDTASIIQRTCIPYLEAYFHHQNTKSHYPVVRSGFFSRNVVPLPTSFVTPSIPREVIQGKLTICLYLTHDRFQTYQNLYREQAREASKTLHTREDDALRMFFYGHLVICTQQLNSSISLTTLMQRDSGAEKHGSFLEGVEPSSRLSTSLGLSVVDLNKLFYWRSSFPTTLTPEFSTILKELVSSSVNYGRAGVDQWDLLTPFTPQKSPLSNFGTHRIIDAVIPQYYTELLRSHPFGILEGPDGVMWTCTLVAVALGAFLWVSKPSTIVNRPAASEHPSEDVAKSIRRSSRVDESLSTRKKKPKHG